MCAAGSTEVELTSERCGGGAEGSAGCLWQERQDHDELEEEYRLLKKLRNRKISEAEYEAGSEAIMDSHMDVAVKTDKKQAKAAKRKLEKNKRLLRDGC